MKLLLMAGIVIALVAGSAFAGVKVGEKVPDFVLQDITGKKHNLAEYKGKPIVLEWMGVSCPFTLEHYERGTMARVYKKYKDKVHWLAIDSSYDAAPSQLYSWSMRWKVPYPILSDKSGQVGRQYGAVSTPQMFVIDTNRVLRYAGAVDDDVTQSKSAITNYVEDAVQALLAGKPVKVKETKPYGCGIKYAPLPFSIPN